MAKRQGAFPDLLDFLRSVLNRLRSKGLASAARTNSARALESMSWRDFERLVGEAFRQKGFTVTGFGAHGPERAVDLGLTKNGERFLVQCKHWRNRQVGVTVIRELNGVMAAQRARGGFVVSGGQFTKEAREFANRTNIELIDGALMEEFIGCTPWPNPTQMSVISTPT
jgi:restriction system protein